MKKLILSAVVILCAFSVMAQFVQGPSGINMITNTGTWQIPPADGGGAATNIPTTQAKWCTVGANGFGVFIKAYGTNAALTTNTWFTLEYGIARNAGTTRVVSNSAPVVVFLPTGVATNGYYTNFATTTANSGNISQVRLKNVMQTNGVQGGSLAGVLFVEEVTLTTR